MKITYVNRRFLDYSIPCLAALNSLIGNKLHVIYSAEAMPGRIQAKLKKLLGVRAIGMTGEWGQKGGDSGTMANHGIVINYQPGLHSKILSTNPDVVVADGFFKWATAGLVCRAIRKVPMVVLYERTAYTERNAQWYRKLYRKLVLPLVDAMCCNGILSKEYAVSLGISADRITVGQAAADSEGLRKQISEVTASEIQDMKRVWDVKGLSLVYVGQLIPRKGVMELLSAWKLFEDELPHMATLVLVGDGPQRELLEKYCTDHDLQCVRFIGSIDYDKIAICYASADVFIIPTLEDNWSMVVPEAMACGLPILSSKYNGCWPELVKSGENGWVFDPHEPKDLLRVLKLTVDNQARLNEMGNCSQRIVDDFSPEHSAKAILEACKLAIKNIHG